jgi:hypothetical protein
VNDSATRLCALALGPGPGHDEALDDLEEARGRRGDSSAAIPMGAALMGSDRERVPYISEASRSLGHTDPGRMSQRGEDPDRSVRSFARPPLGDGITAG